MQTIMNSVLTLSAIEAGRFLLFFAPASLRGLVQSASQSMQAWAAEVRVTLNVHTAADVPRYVRMDAQRLQQVCANLLSNALKFVPHDGSGYVTLAVSSMRNASTQGHEADSSVWVRVAVEDNGCGISEDEQGKLFTAFHQIGTNSKTYASTGLGLAIAHEIVRAHGGRIHCMSTLGRGSTFAMNIPFTQCVYIPDSASPIESSVADAKDPKVATTTAASSIGAGLTPSVVTDMMTAASVELYTSVAAEPSTQPEL